MTDMPGVDMDEIVDYTWPVEETGSTKPVRRSIEDIQIDDIIDLINNDKWKIYDDLLNSLIVEYQETLELVHPYMNDKVFTQHDLNAKLLNIIRRLKSEPIEELKRLKLRAQAINNQKVLTKADELIPDFRDETPTGQVDEASPVSPSAL